MTKAKRKSHKKKSSHKKSASHAGLAGKVTKLTTRVNHIEKFLKKASAA